jgi:hypothetical protein
MGGFTSKAREKKGSAQPGTGPPNPSHGQSVGDDQALAERERILALRERGLAEREAQLKELAAQHNIELPERTISEGPAGGGELGPGSAHEHARRSPPKFHKEQSKELFKHLAGAQASTDRYGTTGAALPVPGGAAVSLERTQQALVRAIQERREVRVFVCSSLQGVDSHSLLTSEVYVRLENDANRRGVGLSFVDLHESLAASAHLGLDSFEFEVRAIDLLLRELDDCCLFIGVLGDCYGKPLGDTMCDALYRLGHTWIEEEGLQSASVEEVLVRKALRSEGIAIAHSHFHLLHSKPRPAAENQQPSPLRWESAKFADESLRKSWRAEVAGKSKERGRLGALEGLAMQHLFSVSEHVQSLYLAFYAGACLVCVRLRRLAR